MTYILCFSYGKKGMLPKGKKLVKRKNLVFSKALRNQQSQMFPKVGFLFWEHQTKVPLAELHRVMQGSFKNCSQAEPFGTMN